MLPQNTLTYAAIMLLAGIGIPTMAALNAGLSERLQSPALGATILFGLATLLSIACLLIFEDKPRSLLAENLPIYYYLGGFFVVFYIMSITWVAPNFGIGNAVSFVLIGQLISMMMIDQFGLMGAPQTSINLQRLIGVIIMAVGVLLVVRK
ncbi:MAG: DMT family transporter [Gammaproteobacteria bacterium]|nr:DMT family transporter [Gammaproteobacteria bacterium]